MKLIKTDATYPMMDELEVIVRLRDGGHALLTALRQDIERLHLEDAVVHPFFKEEDESRELYILEGGDGKEYFSDNGNKGVSLPALVIGKKNYVGILGDVFDMRHRNLGTKKKTSMRITSGGR